MLIVVMLLCLGLGFVFGGWVGWHSLRELIEREGYEVAHHPEAASGCGHYVVRRAGRHV